MKRKLFPALLATTGLLLSLASAETARTTTDQYVAPATESEFLISLGRSYHAQLTLAQLAATRATDPQVKALAQQMVRDYTSSIRSLDRLNKSVGFNPPAGTANGTDVVYTTISALNGTAFDAAYLKETRRVQALNEADSLAVRGYTTNRTLRNYLNNNLPALRTSAQRVTQLGAATGAVTASTSPQMATVTTTASPAPYTSKPVFVPQTTAAATASQVVSSMPVPVANASTTPNARVFIPDTVPTTSTAPVTSEGNLAGTNPGVIPGNGYGFAPVPMPSIPSNAPGTNPGVIPGNGYGFVPTPIPGTIPSNAPGTNPGTIPGNGPGMNPPVTPGVDPNAIPGNLPGTNPGSIPGNGTGLAPVPQPEAVPAMETNAAPGNLPGTNPGSIPGNGTGIAPSQNQDAVPAASTSRPGRNRAVGAPRTPRAGSGRGAVPAPLRSAVPMPSAAPAAVPATPAPVPARMAPGR